MEEKKTQSGLPPPVTPILSSVFLPHGHEVTTVLLHTRLQSMEEEKLERQREKDIHLQVSPLLLGDVTAFPLCKLVSL